MNNNRPCHVERVAGVSVGGAAAESKTATLVVSGMGCNTCVNRVYNALMLTNGVVQVEVSLEAALARVLFDAARIDVGDLVAAVAGAGDGRHVYRAMPVTGAPW